MIKTNYYPTVQDAIIAFRNIKDVGTRVRVINEKLKRGEISIGKPSRYINDELVIENNRYCIKRVK